MYWLRLNEKQAPEGRNSKNTHVRQDHPAQTLEKSCPKSFPNKPGVVCPHDEFLIPQAKICLWEQKHVGVRRISSRSEYFPYSTHCILFSPHACEAGTKCVPLRSVFNGISLHPFEEAVQTTLRRPLS